MPPAASNRVEVLKTTADRKTRAGRITRVDKPAMMRSEDRRLGAPLPTSIHNLNLMPHQDGFRDNGPEATRLSKPDDCDDRMQEKE
jgi:hypothetical protein